VVLAGQVGVKGHLTIGQGARIGAQSGVMSDVPAGSDLFGYPARPVREAMRAIVASYRLADIVGDLENLVKRGKPGEG
jgi:UDP-3-O-[3-hydroxymyristoyl] glucosamine N-acyltransferase